MHLENRLSDWAVFSVLVCLLAAPVQAADWGTLKGRFVYDGPKVVPEKLTINKDVQVCSKHTPIDESLLVDENGGVANVLVYIRVPRGETLDVHPDYEKTADAEVVLDNKHCRFAPHVALLRTSQKLVLKNSDPVGHNTKADCFFNPSFNVLIPSGGSIEQQMGQPERLPVRVACNIHPWMSGFLLIREDPYMAVSAEDGTFQIQNIPAGTHEFQFWHEKSGYLGGIKLGSAGETEKRGRAELAIKSGTLDLGNVTLPAALFEE